MASNGHKDASGHDSADYTFVNDSAENDLHGGTSSLVDEEQQTAPRVSVCHGLNLPAHSMLTGDLVAIDSITPETLGLAPLLPLYHNNGIGYFVFADKSKSGMPTALSSTAGFERYMQTVQPSYIGGDKGNLVHAQVSTQKLANCVSNRDVNVDNDGQRSNASSQALSTASTCKATRAPKGCGKDPPPPDTFLLQAMRGDGKKLIVKELRYVLPAMGKVILSWDLTAPTVNWDSVKSYATAYEVDPDRCYDPNNPDKSSSGLKKANKCELQDIFEALKSILDEICRVNPNYMEKYDIAAALAEGKSSTSVQVQVNDSDGEVADTVVPVSVQELDDDITNSATVTGGAMSSVSADRKNEHLAASQRPTCAWQPICESDSLLLNNNCRLSSAVQDAQTSQYTVVTEDDVHSSTAIGSFQSDYLQVSTLGLVEIDARSVNLVGPLNDVPNTSSYTPATAANVEMPEKMSAAVLVCQDVEKPAFGLLNENYDSYFRPYNATLSDTKMPLELVRQLSEEFNAYVDDENIIDDELWKLYYHPEDEIEPQDNCDAQETNCSEQVMNVLESHPRHPSNPAAALLGYLPVGQPTEDIVVEMDGSPCAYTQSVNDDESMDFG
jgi:hypothetical protein